MPKARKTVEYLKASGKWAHMTRREQEARIAQQTEDDIIADIVQALAAARSAGLIRAAE